MLALYALGRQHEALDLYLRLRRHLDDDLGLEPMPPTKALHAAVLRHEDVEELLPRPASPPSHLVSLREAPLRLLGRAEELDTVGRVVRRALEGSFSLMLIEGEAGMGKSRLLAELDASFPTTRIGRASCSQLERHLPYVPLAEAVRTALEGVDDPRALPALRRILPERALDEPGPSYPEIDALEALIELVRAHAPMVLVLDDLQWADPATLAAIAYLQRRCPDVPLAVVGAARTEEIDPDHALRRLAPSLVLELGPLTAEDLSSVPIPELHERTGGNPAFVAAAIRQGTTRDLGRTLAAPLLARCRAEGPGGNALLLCASVLDDPFEPAILAEVADVHASALAEQLDHLCARGLLEVDGLRYRFRYGIHRDALRNSMSPARQRILHARRQSAERDRAWLERTDRLAISPGPGVPTG
jgi:hypothetical protein